MKATWSPGCRPRRLRTSAGMVTWPLVVRVDVCTVGSLGVLPAGECNTSAGHADSGQISGSRPAHWPNTLRRDRAFRGKPIVGRQPARDPGGTLVVPAPASHLPPAARLSGGASLRIERRLDPVRTPGCPGCTIRKGHRPEPGSWRGPFRHRRAGGSSGPLREPGRHECGRSRLRPQGATRRALVVGVMTELHSLVTRLDGYGDSNENGLDGKRLSRCFHGADRRIRTADLLITNQLLYQLSYIGVGRGASIGHGPGRLQSARDQRGASRA